MGQAVTGERGHHWIFPAPELSEAGGASAAAVLGTAIEAGSGGTARARGSREPSDRNSLAALAQTARR